MFERYTESARGALFLARYEACQRGSLSIESEHLLLGLTRENQGPVSSILAHFQVMPPILLREIDVRSPQKERVPPAEEIPFSREVQDALNGARDEADRLRHRHIGSEHLFLGVVNRRAHGRVVCHPGLTNLAGDIGRCNHVRRGGDAGRDHTRFSQQNEGEAFG